MEIDRIYNVDCLEGMKLIPGQAIDCVICDLPYGKTRNQWDTQIPLAPLWAQYERIVKPNGAIILFGQGVFTAELICSNKALYRYSLVWEKTRAGGFLNANRMPLQSHEDIAVFYKKPPVYHPQMERCERTAWRYVHNGDGGNYGGFSRVGQIYDNHGLHYPKSILKFPYGNHKSLHRTAKPVDLIRYLIRTYTNIGDVVLDNCMGSGTTAVAAIMEHRHFIGFEKDKDIFGVALSRMEAEHPNQYV